MDGLTLLIKSLTKNEKRYITIRLAENLRGGESTLLNLFNIIDVLTKEKKPISNEVLAEKTSIKHIYSTKKLLKEAILKALRNYHENANFRWRIEALRKNGELFLSKRLPRQALREIEKAIDIAQSHEAHLLFCDLETFRLECHKEMFRSKTLLDEIDHTFEQIHLALQNSSEFFKHKRSYEIARAKFKINGVARTQEMQQKTKQDFKQSVPELITKNMRSHCFMNAAARGVHNFMVGEFEQSYQAQKQVYDLLDENPHEKLDSAKQYLNTLYNLIVSCYFTNRAYEIPKLLEAFKATETKLFSDYLFQIERYYNISFNLKLNENDLETLNNLTTEFESIFDRVESHMDREFKLILMGQCANIYLFTSQIKKAKKWNNMLLNHTKSKIRSDIMVTSLMRDLVIAFEEKKIGLLLSKIKNVKVNLSSKRKLYSAELVIIKAFKEIIDQNLYDDKKAVLEKIRHVFEDPKNSRILDQFNYVRYFEAKV